MTELETILLQKLSELSTHHKTQYDALHLLVEKQSKHMQVLTEQVNHLSRQLESLSTFELR